MNPYLRQDFKSYLSDSLYVQVLGDLPLVANISFIRHLVLTQDQLTEIWKSAG